MTWWWGSVDMTYNYLPPACIAQVTYNTSRNGNSVLVIARQVICHTAFARVHETTAEGFLVDLFPRRGFDERRPSKEDTSLFANDDVFVCHGGDISATCDGDAVHDGDLGYPERGHLGLRDTPIKRPSHSDHCTPQDPKGIPYCKICARSAPCRGIPAYMRISAKKGGYMRARTFAWCGRAAPPDSTRAHKKVCEEGRDGRYESTFGRTDIDTG